MYITFLIQSFIKYRLIRVYEWDLNPIKTSQLGLVFILLQTSIGRCKQLTVSKNTNAFFYALKRRVVFSSHADQEIIERLGLYTASTAPD